ncbi:MAG: hypothetical protein Q8R53_04730 [Nanoarchaeota archaeon]|nr:hypothetical protein [Nanoarchaeota archaeon]
MGRLPSEMRFTAQKLCDEEEKKAEVCGFIPRDLHSGNVLYNPLERKVYFIDLELWQRS